MKRRCRHCSRAFRTARADAKFCSAICRHSHWRRRLRIARALARSKCAACRKAITITRRADARYCSPRCRQHDYRARKAAAPLRKAHQRVIRERLAAKDPRAGGDIGNATVRAITLTEARPLIEQYEWLGNVAAVTRHCFGIFFAGELGGAVMYGDEYAESLGVWDRYGYSGKIIALLRGASTHWAHPHAASKLIRRSMLLLPERFKVVTATVDANAGEIGSVYQAAGFDYVGVMRAGGRALVRVNGRFISERQAGRLAGTRGARALAQLGFDVIPTRRKARYFAFRGRERRHLRRAIEHLIQPYPKRA